MTDDGASRRRHSPYLVAVSEETHAARRHYAPSAERNTQPILAVLKQNFPASGRVLEVASGTGQHIAAFGRAFPSIAWQPSDPTPEARESIAAWVEEEGLDNVSAPLDIDLIKEDWTNALEGPLDAVLAINLLHISPWLATLGLLKGSARLLAPGAPLYIYGAFKRDGVHISDSNAAFDESLRIRNAEWGVRDIADVAGEAEAHGLRLAETIPMPANNFSLIFKRRGAGPEA